MEVTSVHDLEIRIPMERALILLGKKLIMNRFSINSGVQLIEMVNEVREGEEHGKDDGDS